MLFIKNIHDKWQAINYQQMGVDFPKYFHEDIKNSMQKEIQVCLAKQEKICKLTDQVMKLTLTMK